MARQIAHQLEGWHSPKEAARVAGLSLAMVNYLCRSHVIEPSCDCARGHGRQRHYDFSDFVSLRLVARLSASGVSPLRMRLAFRGLRDMKPPITLTTLPASHVVSDGVDLYLRREGEPLERLIDGQRAFGFVIELRKLQAEVAQALAA